ncbi:preprotein translocase subunit SecE [bacterium]|jgi:preprotein translocase SecE subunit|nr:preprotein translocase subunit SecE [bacterium]MBT3795669.1 preprotein translocase subunit SecE [bacterium]MBT4634530.1 preprotein translocase subunit SecE [bacterium]
MKKFFDDIKSELGKISWINKRENIKSTGGVVLVTIILGVFLLLVDFVLSSITELLLGGK